MILERLEKLEDRMENIDNKMSIVMGNLTGQASNVFYVLKVTFAHQLTDAQIDQVFHFFHSELRCSQCYFALDKTTNVQFVFNHNDAIHKFSIVIDVIKHDLKLNISQISLMSDIDLSTSSDCLMLYKPSMTQLIKRRLVK